MLGVVEFPLLLYVADGSSYSEQRFPLIMDVVLLVIDVADDSSHQYFILLCVSRAIVIVKWWMTSHLLSTLSKRVASGNIAK